MLSCLGESTGVALFWLSAIMSNDDDNSKQSVVGPFVLAVWLEVMAVGCVGGWMWL